MTYINTPGLSLEIDDCAPHPPTKKELKKMEIEAKEEMVLYAKKAKIEDLKYFLKHEKDLLKLYKSIKNSSLHKLLIKETEERINILEYEIGVREKVLPILETKTSNQRRM